ncbi:ABC transporter ATP-binding protein [Haliscomenobacter sp.]|uniref:ABC transporter ATP-binding protein n=1 Tax=Haliscomenobacter sp. TaxID=2717303 RepID=UPI003593EDA0
MSMARNRADRAEGEQRKLSGERLRRSLKVFQYILPYKWPFIWGMFFLIVGSGLFLVIMKLPGEILNIISGESKYGLSTNMAFFVVIALLAVQSVFSYLRVQLFAVVSEKSMAALRRDLYQKLVTLGIPFLEERRVGELTSRITSDVTQVQGVVSLTIAEFIRQIIVFLGGVFIIVFTMPKLALIMLATVPIVVISAMFFGRYIRKLMRARQDQLAETNVVVEETMQSIQTVKAYTNEDFEVKRYSSSLTEMVSISLKAARMRGLFAAFIIFVMFGALFFIIWQAAIMVEKGEMLKGDLLDFAVFTGIIGTAIASLGNFYTEIVSAIGATERILDIMDQPSEVTVQTLTAPEGKQRFSGEISYRDVHFSYPSRPDMPVLKGVSFDIAAGSKIALVGASGGGKSTIMQLLLQFYGLGTGEILVDGQSIYDYELSLYRQNIGIVPQEVLLFGGSIRENIAYGRPGSSDEEIIEAARQANAWNFINSFPEGLDTLVGERGVKLSGGQRQRVAIARAILKDPAILLLDEATSSLDAESEKLVQEALNRLMVGRTSVIIAHRLATVRDVDCIYVLDGGTIIEKGTHDELSSIPDGAYNALAKLQFELA